MTRLSIDQLPPKMRQQALKQIQEDELRKKKSLLLQDIEEEFKEKRNKLKAEKITLPLPDGTEHTFDSKKEATIYTELRLRQKAGEIKDLRIQVPYELIPKQKLTSGKIERSVKYVADFVYEEDGETKVVDVKGYRGGAAYAVFVIKRKLMKWVHNIEVIEV